MRRGFVDANIVSYGLRGGRHVIVHLFIAGGACVGAKRSRFRIHEKDTYTMAHEYVCIEIVLYVFDSEQSEYL